MSELKRPHAKVYFSDIGPRRAPVVLFAHGLLFSSSMFHYQIDHLRSTHRCVSIDFRGHGLTQARGPFALSDISDDLEALLDHIGEPVHFVGHSMGSYLGIPLAAAMPRRFRTLTLIGASANAEDPDVAARYHRFANVYRATGKRMIAQRVKDIMFSPESQRSARVRGDMDTWIEELGYPSRTELRTVIRAVANRYGVQCEAASIRVPTQIIAGAEDVANPPIRAQRLKELMPHASLHTLDGVGHVPPLEAPRDVNQLLTNFFWAAGRRVA